VTDVEHLERVRKDFVANISHELRTPLAAIRGYAETLLDGAAQDPAANRKFLEIICRNTVRLGDMASDLLALSEMESEREPPPAEKVSVREAAAAALAAVENEAVARHVDVFAGAIEDVHVMGQRFRLEHALVNLLANGIRFNRAGGEVRLAAILVGDRVRITVSDTGIGIPFQDLPRIFERFYCVDKARSRETGGTGLGLAIVKHAAERMAGTVTVESRPGKDSFRCVSRLGQAPARDIAQTTRETIDRSQAAGTRALGALRERAAAVRIAEPPSPRRRSGKCLGPSDGRSGHYPRQGARTVGHGAGRVAAQHTLQTLGIFRSVGAPQHCLTVALRRRLVDCDIHSSRLQIASGAMFTGRSRRKWAGFCERRARGLPEPRYQPRP
jgi:anti-sigma regulatory factor (Ser/Thr protein kinase)